MSDAKMTTLARLDQMFHDPVRIERSTMLAPKGFDVQRMFMAVLALVGRNPDLQSCDPNSIVRCVTQACELGLSPTGVLGGAYLVPFNDQLTLIIGYRGMIDLARRSGQVSTIEAHVVYDKDEFHFTYGTHPSLSHKPPLSGERGQPVAFYAVATLSDGAKQFEVMAKEQVDGIRERSKAKKGPWSTDYDEMGRKTVVRRLCKYLPLTAEAAQAIDAVEEEEFTDAEVVSRGVADAGPVGVSKLKERLATPHLDEVVNAAGKLEEEGWETPPPEVT